MKRLGKRALRAVLLLMAGLGASIAGSAPEGDSDLKALLREAQRFAAEAMGVAPSQVLIPPLDRRARKPACEEALRFRWPFATQDTLEVFCPSGGGRLFLRVEQVQGKEVVVAARPLKEGEQLTADALRLSFAESEELGSETFSEVRSLLGRTLSRPLEPGDRLSKGDLVGPSRGWIVQRAANPGETLTASALAPLPSNSQVPDLYLGALPGPDERLRVLKPLTHGQPLRRRDIERERAVLIAEANLAAGLRLPHPQIKSTWTSARGLPGDTLSPSALPELVELTRPLRAGAVLRASDLTSAVLVEKGATVRVAIEQGQMILEADLVAENAGALGAEIVVQNPETGRRLRAVVTGPGKASHRSLAP